MKLENNQSYGVNAQFSGGRPIGAGQYGLVNNTYSKAVVDLSSVANYTGSFILVDQFGQSTSYYLTGSSNSAVISGSSFIPVSGSIANTLVNIKNFLNASASAVVTANTAAANLQLTSSINGAAGNVVTFTNGAYSGSVVTGSVTTSLSGGSGFSDYPYTFPFVAGGLYVGQLGTLIATTVDNSTIQFVSASGFIPGVFKSVDSATTAASIIALK
jgi:hypothetical protein